MAQYRTLIKVTGKIWVLFNGPNKYSSFLDLDWFNVDHPLVMNRDLQNSVILLDFFTYCCINCMHMLPTLKKIEHDFPATEGFVVIGVHNAKFTNEKESKNVEAAIRRYEIEHPVVNDFRCGLWKKLDVHCWPTMLIVGPGLNPLFVLMGENTYDFIHNLMVGVQKYYKESGLLQPISTFQILKDSPRPASNLKFPGKLQCSRYSVEDQVPELYALSDSGNHRILVFDEHGRVLHKIGTGTMGFQDGDFQTAQFNAPQGVTFYNQYTLYVADTENHAIRKIDLRDRYVETVVGTGKQGTDLVGLKKGKEQAISSPWDLFFLKTKEMTLSVYMNDYEIPLKSVCLIAMAGTHQIWAYFMEDTVWWRYKKYAAGQCVAIAGNGEERNRNNFFPHQASFAQPSGITYHKKTEAFYIADSESSSVRLVALKDGEVSAVVGGNINPMVSFLILVDFFC
jgi:thiol-disulfide isomerase/thioredoxin